MNAKAEAVKRVEDAASVLREALDVQRRVERKPYGMVAGALAVGFVLGGGLFSRITAKILGAGIRIGLMAAVPIIERVIVQAVTGSKSDINKKD